MDNIIVIEEGIQSFMQFGFRQQYSTCHALIYVTEIFVFL